MILALQDTASRSLRLASATSSSRFALSAARSSSVISRRGAAMSNRSPRTVNTAPASRRQASKASGLKVRARLCPNSW